MRKIKIVNNKGQIRKDGSNMSGINFSRKPPHKPPHKPTKGGEDKSKGVGQS